MAREKEKKGPSHRLARVEREIRDVVSIYLLGGFRGDLPGMVSVTRVGVGGDIRSARVFVILILTQDEGETAEAFEKRMKVARKQTVDELNEYAHEVQTEVARKLQMRFTPKITFAYDDGYENAMKVEGILRKIEETKAKTSDDASADDDQLEDE